MSFWLPFGALWIQRASLGVLSESFGGPLGDWGSLDVLLGAVGCLEDLLVVPGSSWEVPGRLGGDFWDLLGNSGRPFGSILGPFLVFCSVCFWPMFFDEFLKGFCTNVGIILGAFLESFFSTSPTSRKKLHPTKML